MNEFISVRFYRARTLDYEQSARAITKCQCLCRRRGVTVARIAPDLEFRCRCLGDGAEVRRLVIRVQRVHERRSH